MNLSEVESQIMDVLTLHSPDWKINPDIAIQIGRMHNYTAKILAQLKKKGLVDARYVIDGGEKQTYKEYRLKATEKPSEAVKGPDTQSHTKQDVGFHQESKLCECGKSWFTFNGKCNICGVKRIAEEIDLPKMKAKPMRRLWSKKLHRYLTQDEIKSGMVGG